MATPGAAALDAGLVLCVLMPKLGDISTLISKHALDASSAFRRGIVASYRTLPHKVMLQLGGRRSCPGAVSLVPLVGMLGYS